MGEDATLEIVLKRAVVSGAAGFVGSHMCDRLLAEGIAVLALDNLLTGVERNLDQLRGQPNFEFRMQDVTLPFDSRFRKWISLSTWPHPQARGIT